jgi:putative transposase
MSTKVPILPGKYYHLYNHANGNLNLFRNEENFRFFLEKYLKHVHPLVDTFAYCLMPNHFHFLIWVKEEVEKVKLTSNRSDLFKRSDLLEVTPIQVTNSIKNWLISYTKSYHKVYGTRGNLFQQKIRRKLISDEDYLLNLIGYIHLNPVIHGFTKNLKDWEHSSFNDYSNNSYSFCNKEQVMNWFGDKGTFLNYHNQKMVANMLKIIDLNFQIP